MKYPSITWAQLVLLSCICGLEFAYAQKYYIKNPQTGKCITFNEDDYVAVTGDCSCNAGQRFNLLRNNDNSITLKLESSGKGLDVRGGSKDNSIQIIQYEYKGQTNQQWTIHNSADAPNVYLIRSVLSNKCVDIQGGGTGNGVQIIQYDCKDDSSNWNQKWEFVDAAQVEAGRQPQNGPEYQIINTNTNKCVDVYLGSSDNLQKVIQYSCGQGATNQQWYFVCNGANKYQIKSVRSSRCLDSRKGKPLVQADCDNSGNQAWTVEKKSDDVFYLHNNNKCMDVPGQNGNDGEEMQIYDCNGTPAQTFKVAGFQESSCPSSCPSTLFTGSEITFATPLPKPGPPPPAPTTPPPAPPPQPPTPTCQPSAGVPQDMYNFLRGQLSWLTPDRYQLLQGGHWDSSQLVYFTVNNQIISSSSPEWVTYFGTLTPQQVTLYFPNNGYFNDIFGFITPQFYSYVIGYQYQPQPPIQVIIVPGQVTYQPQPPEYVHYVSAA